MKPSGKLSVSLMCADLLNMEQEIRICEKCGADYLHIDIMDAAFVPNLTFGPGFVNAVRRKTTLPLEIHLLMEQPVPDCSCNGNPRGRYHHHTR